MTASKGVFYGKESSDVVRNLIIKQVWPLCLTDLRVAPILEGKKEGNTDYFDKTCILCSHGGEGRHPSPPDDGRGTDVVSAYWLLARRPNNKSPQIIHTRLA